MDAPCIVYVERGRGEKDKIDHAALSPPGMRSLWAALEGAARNGGKAPQKALWNLLDPNLAEKSSRVKVAVQAIYQKQLLFFDRALDEWKQAASTVAVGALMLFRDGVEDRDADTYEPFELVDGRSRVRSTKRRAKWERAVQAHAALVASERFGGLTPERLAGLFLLTRTPDHLPGEVESFDLDFWLLRVMHLSLERNVDLKLGAFAPTPAKERAEGDNGDAAVALRQLETIVALKVAIFYKKRHRGAAPPPRVSRHDVEETKRKCLKRPRAPKPRCEAAGVADYVRVAMRHASLQQLLPVGDVVQGASRERARIGARIQRLDLVVCAHEAWRRLMARVPLEQAALELVGTGVRLEEDDSVWREGAHEAVRKLVAVGAGGGWRPRVVHAHTASELRSLIGDKGTSGLYGSAAVAKAARAEMGSLAERLLALLSLEFRLRETAVERTTRPLELQQQGELAVADAPPCGKVPAHVEAYARALKAQRGRSKHGAAFAAAVQRALVRAINGAFFGCFEVVSFGNGCGPHDPAAWTHPHVRASLAIMHRMLNIAARYNGLVAQDCEDEEAVPVVVYDREAETFHMADFLEHAVAHNWPAVRALADVAVECEPWVRDFRKRPPAALCQPQDGGQPLWVRLGKGGLAVDHAAKDATLARLAADDNDTAERWWDAWPPTRDEVLSSEARIATAIAWGGKATAAFLGIAQPDQFVGRAPFG
jgi:hypothetical protein